MLKVIEQKVSIECKYLDREIESHILEKLRNTMVGYWTLDYGYIIKVISILSIGDNYINPATSLVMFDVKYEIETLKPSKGLLLDGIVCMIFQHGLFVDIYGKMKVLIPANTMSKFIFDDTTKCFRDDDKNISVEDHIKIKLTSVQYSDKKYVCIGSLI